MHTLTTFCCIALLACTAGCATIVSGSKTRVSLASNPEGAWVTVTNRHNEVVQKVKTPTTVRLRRSAGIFRKEKYILSFAMKGYDTTRVQLDCRLNEWYIGNIAFGGVIGFLIVDPITGAMYKLKTEEISVDLIKQSSPATGLMILNKQDVPASWLQHLERIN